MIEWLQGKKTYFVATAGIITAGVSWLNGSIDLSQFVQAGFAACGIAALKAGQSRVETKTDNISKRV
jgi:type IV secretory pathway VirB2 component (pilin)